MQGYSIQMLGTFHCLYDNQPLTKLPTGKLQLLFAYLLLHSEVPLNRKHLAFLFWPDSTEAQALNNLRKLLYDLKHLLPASNAYLEFKDGHVIWSSRDACRVDVLTFERQSLQDSALTELIEAAALYKGELLPGIYDEWVVDRRETLSRHYAALLQQIIGLYEQKREFDAALTYAMKLLQLDRLSESAHLTVIRLYALNGDVAASHNHFEEMTALFEAELDIPPSGEARSIMRQLCETGIKAELTYINKRTSPLIGRRKEWEQLLKAWDKAVHQHSLLVVLEGEAGIGKTRLAEEFVFWAQSQGIRALTSRCYASGGTSAYEPVIAWLQRVSFEHLDQPALIEISRMLPEVRERYPELPLPGPLRESWQLRSWYHANQQVLFQEQPTLLVLDDLQWSDKETLQMIDYFLRTAHPFPLLILGTIRSEASPRDAYMKDFLHSLRTRRQSIHIALTPLTEAETGQLIRAYWEQGPLPLPPKQIHEESGGNPLFILEIVRAGTGSISEGYGSSVVAVMVHRLADLPPVCQKVIAIMTVLGKPASLSFLFGLVHSPELTLEQVELLQQMRILKRIENGGLDFYHERMREAARIRMSESQKQLLHGIVAEAMERSENIRNFSAAEIAYHYEYAGSRQEAVIFYEKAAEEAKQVFAHEMTIRYCLKVLDLTGQETKLKALSLLAEAYRISGKWEHAEKTYRNWLQLCESSVPLEQKALHQAALGNCLRLQGKYPEALLHLKQASQIFDMLDDRRGLSEAYGYMGIVYQYLGEYDDAEHYLKKRIELSPDGEEDGKFTGIIGNVYFDQGQYAEAMNYYKRSVRIANGKGDKHALGQAFGGMALIYMEWEQFDWAFHSIGEKLSISRSLGDRMGVANSIGLMGKAYMRGGYYKEAAACLLFCLQEALQIGDVRVIALVLGLIGYTLDEQGIDEAGWRALEQSERIAATLGIPPIYCDTLYFMGHYAVKRERWDDAQRFIQQAVPLAEKHRRQGLICMLELLALRVHAGKNEAPPLDISDRLQLLLNRHPGRKEQAMIHVAQWELTGSEESRIQAVIQMEDLYRNAPVPYYMKWETILRIKLKGTLMNPPPIPREASQLEANLEEILEVVGDL